MHTKLLVVQPTPFCNIDCTYCYLPHRQSKKQLSLERALKVFETVFKFPTVSGALTIVWHAGEPMVLPVSYYKPLFEGIKSLTPPNLTIRHSFQTNGTLISADWCAFIKAWSISIGVSIDGPREFHDLYRKQRNGGGSFDRTYKGMQLLKQHDIAFHVISVLTRESLAHPEKLYQFYAGNDVEFICFNIEEQEGLNSQSLLVSSKDADVQYAEFLRKFLALNLRSARPIPVREVEHAVGAIRYHGDVVHNAQAEPFAIISVDCDGNISTFSPELLGLKHNAYSSFEFGNVITDTFEDISSRVHASAVYRDIVAGVEQCEQTCEYFGLCGGGAPVNKIFENGSAATTETLLCRTFKRSVDVCLDLIDQIPKHPATSVGDYTAV